MKYIPRTLGFIWCLPATLLYWIIVILPLHAFGVIKWEGWYSYLVASFTVNEDSFFAMVWGDWWGTAGYCVMIYRGRTVIAIDHLERTKKHEEAHVDQAFKFGIFFYPVYFLASVYLYFFTDKHPYLDNPFERDARQAAGQMVDIPKKYRDTYDRWPWW